MHLIDTVERRFYQQEFTLNCLQKSLFNCIYLNPTLNSNTAQLVLTPIPISIYNEKVALFCPTIMDFGQV